MSLNIVSSFNGVTDPDAGRYIADVEAADGLPLEFAVGKAIDDFVVGCKVDGIWDAIKASCILAGARTFAGALIPLKGTAPTKFGTEGNWSYNRKDGLQGDGSTNYLDSNRNNNADPQNSKHVSVYVDTVGNLGYLASGAGSSSGVTQLYNGNGFFLTRNNQTTAGAGSIGSATTGLFGISRNNNTTYTGIRGGTETVVTANSDTPNNANIILYNIPTLTYFTNARLAFYSIGESLDLAKLDSRVTDLINAFGAAIP